MPNEYFKMKEFD